MKASTCDNNSIDNANGLGIPGQLMGFDTVPNSNHFRVVKSPYFNPLSHTCTGGLSDTAIQPRALWGRDEGLSQEEALQMVAAHDASALEDALSRGLAAIGATTALLNWATAKFTAI